MKRRDRAERGTPRRVLLGAGITAVIALTAPSTAAAVVPVSCGGPADPSFAAHRVITGELSTEQEGGYVYLPFDVPASTTAVRVRYCHDQPELAPPTPLPNAPKHVIDLGLFDARTGAGGMWGGDEFRGSTGSSVRDVTVSPNGFTSDAVYESGRKAHVQGFTTRGYQPGPIPAGEWAVELGVAAVASQPEFDADGTVAFRVEIELSQDSLWASDPYSPTPYDPTPADPDPGWYEGDFHVHGEHEPGNATMRETFDYAFGPYGGAGAGLDFVTLVDHNNTVAYGEIGRYQPDYPGKLIVRSTEVTTYRGHIQNHASGQFVDYRTGPLYEAALADAGGVNRTLASLSLERDPRPASAIFSAINAAGGLTQINHPTIFPSEVPTFDDFCRGCSWGYSAAETGYAQVDAIEIATGPAGLQTAPFPGPNPFTPLAVRFWEDAIDSGGVNSNKIAAVGSSDSHQAIARSAIDPTSVTDAPIGMATTVVHADELSEDAVQEAVEAGHTYVKPWGSDGPDLRLEATIPGSSAPPAIIGDTVVANSAQFTATVKNLDEAMAARPGAYMLFVVRNGLPFTAAPIPSGQDEFEFRFPAAGPARYRLQVDRTATGGASVEALSSPIYVEAPGGSQPPPGSDPPPEAPGGAGGDASGPCSQAKVGSEGADELVGSDLGDRIDGRGGDDAIFGAGGEDCLAGNEGDDELNGGEGRDRVRGGPGDDFIDVKGQGRDRVRCGPGRDRVRAGRRDRVRGCERVRVA